MQAGQDVQGGCARPSSVETGTSLHVRECGPGRPCSEGIS